MSPCYSLATTMVTRLYNSDRLNQSGSKLDIGDINIYLIL
jgi:hypothetical protein